MNSTNEPVTRLAERHAPQMCLRVVRGASTSLGFNAPGWLHVEWAGRVGHPSSYGLLGGMRAAASLIQLQESGAAVRDSLAGPHDDVRWGLAPDYEPAILAALDPRLQPVLHDGRAGRSRLLTSRLQLARAAAQHPLVDRSAGRGLRTLANVRPSLEPSSRRITRRPETRLGTQPAGNTSAKHPPATDRTTHLGNGLTLPMHSTAAPAVNRGLSSTRSGRSSPCIEDISLRRVTPARAADHEVAITLVRCCHCLGQPLR